MLSGEQAECEHARPGSNSLQTGHSKDTDLVVRCPVLRC